jgi:hypothetical protein
MHNDERMLYLVAYFSKKLDCTQKRYAIQERELLGIMLALQYWRHWVKGGDITIIIDHEFFKQINIKAKQLARIIRFLDTIEHYEIRIIYRPGKANVLADYLFRSSEIAHSATKFEPTATAKPLRLEQFNRLNLQAICKHLLKATPLPSNLDALWVCK